MKSIDEVKGNCRIDDDGCWIWAGAVGPNGVPRVYAPNAQGRQMVMNGRRAVWHLQNPGKALAAGQLVFGTCHKLRCLNPACASQGTMAELGELIAKERWLVGRVKRRINQRAFGRAHTVLTEDIRAAIDASDESSPALAKRLGISYCTVWRYRTGRIVCFQPIGGVFSQLATFGARA